MNGGPPVSDLDELLSSRRRLYPAVYPGDHEDDNGASGRAGDLLGGGLRGQPEEEDIRMMSKKDLESLVYQANPALTVGALPERPEIDFR